MNWLYSSGAIILLIASLFFVMGWDYARVLFGAGLFIEIVVFLISVIDPTSSHTELKEEIVFPSVSERKHSKEIRLNSPKQVESTNNTDLRVLTQTIQEMNATVNVLLNTTKDLAGTVDHLEQDYGRLAHHSDHHRRELELIQKQLRETAQKIKDI